MDDLQMDDLQQDNQNNKKTFLSSLTAKIILTLVIFAGSAIIIISGTKFIIEYYCKTPNSNKIIKQVKQTEQEKNQIETADLLFEASATEDWQIYQNEEYGFEVKYPEEWKQCEGENICFRKDINFGHPRRFTEIDIKANQNNQNLSLSKIVSDFENIGRIYNQKEYITINNKKIFKAEIVNWGMVAGRQFLINGDNYWYNIIISGTNVENVEIDQILSTFKFIEKDEKEDWQIYRNEEYGFEVKYPKNNIKIKQIDDTFYIAYSNFGDITEQGQFVRIFTKDSKDSLKQAIEKKFLKNYSKEDCFLLENKDLNKYLENKYNKYPKSYILMPAISYPKDKYSESQNNPLFNKCPPVYSQSNGISYFLMDNNYPDKFAFFSIGQYSISAPLEDVEVFWQDTFKFIK